MESEEEAIVVAEERRGEGRGALSFQTFECVGSEGVEPKPKKEEHSHRQQTASSRFGLRCILCRDRIETPTGRM